MNSGGADGFPRVSKKPKGKCVHRGAVVCTDSDTEGGRSRTGGAGKDAQLQALSLHAAVMADELGAERRRWNRRGRREGRGGGSPGGARRCGSRRDAEEDTLAVADNGEEVVHDERTR